MKIQCVWEHNGDDSILYSANFVGAFTRGKSKDEAVRKMPSEILSYLAWKGDAPPDALEPEIVQEKASALTVSDADSDVLFNDEKAPLTAAEYEALKSLAMKSARDFLALYRSIPDKDKSALPPRATFYGEIPRTAREMYKHTKNVNTYYFGEIDPSHATGKADLVAPMAYAATAAGADGIMVEVHNDPAHALCDGAQSITPPQFDEISRKVRQIREVLV